MGIISSALAAAGDAGVQSMNQNIQQMNQQELDKQRSDLETQKQLAIMQAQKQMTIDAANQQRESQVARINAAVPGVVQGQLDAKYADANAAAAGQTDAPLTPEQQAVIDQSKATDKAALASDPHAYIKAAMATGDIDPHTVAQLAQQEDALRRQEAAQAAQFAQSDKSQSQSQAFQAQQQAKAQSFQAGQNSLNREAMSDRADAKLKANMPPDDITDAEKKNWVHTYVTNNGSVPRSAPAYVRNSIGTWAAQMGITPDAIAQGTAQMKFDQSSAVTAGHRGGAMAGVEAAMPALISNAVGIAQKLDRGSFVPINKLENMADDSISNPTLSALKVAHQAMASEYQMVISRGGTNVTSLKEAMHVLDMAKSPEAYIAAANQVQNEVNINQAAMSHVRGNLGSQGGQSGAGSIPNPFEKPATGAALTYDPKTGTFH